MNNITQEDINSFLEAIESVQKSLKETQDKRKGGWYKELKENFHTGKYWSVKMFDQWAKEKDRGEITTALMSISHHKVDATFIERIKKKYRVKRIAKNTPKLDEIDSLIEHFKHLKKTTNWTEKEIIAFIHEHFHKSLAINKISSRIKYYKSIGLI